MCELAGDGLLTVSALEYLPRAEQGAPGSVKNFKIYLFE